MYYGGKTLNVRWLDLSKVFYKVFPAYSPIYTHINRHTTLAASYQAWPPGEMLPFRVFPEHFHTFAGEDGDWTANSGFLLYDISLC